MDCTNVKGLRKTELTTRPLVLQYCVILCDAASSGVFAFRCGRYCAWRTTVSLVEPVSFLSCVNAKSSIFLTEHPTHLLELSALRLCHATDDPQTKGAQVTFLGLLSYTAECFPKPSLICCSKI